MRILAFYFRKLSGSGSGSVTMGSHPFLHIVPSISSISSHPMVGDLSPLLVSVRRDFPLHSPEGKCERTTPASLLPPVPAPSQWRGHGLSDGWVGEELSSNHSGFLSFISQFLLNLGREERDLIY